MRADTVLMKEINKNLIRKTLRVMEKATKSELAQITGLSVVTVNSLISEMVSEKEVLEGESIPSQGGRPSLLYYYNKDFRHGVIIYGFQKKEKNHIKLLVINLKGQIVLEEEEDFETVEVDSFFPLIDRAVNSFPTIMYIAFGLPGVEEDGVITINDYKALVGEEFIQTYKKRYGLPILFENDINAAVKGYYYVKRKASLINSGACKVNNVADAVNSTGSKVVKATREINDIVGIYFPRTYEPGAGIIINGEIYRGYKNFAGEFSGIPFLPRWAGIDYCDKDLIVDRLSDTLSLFSCILAPERFVIYGDFLTENLREEIIKRTEEKLNNKFPIALDISEEFYYDFQIGMIGLVLDKLQESFIKGDIKL